MEVVVAIVMAVVTMITVVAKGYATRRVVELGTGTPI
jgi:hypothetical protein